LSFVSCQCILTHAGQPPNVSWQTFGTGTQSRIKQVHIAHADAYKSFLCTLKILMLVILPGHV